MAALLKHFILSYSENKIVYFKFRRISTGFWLDNHDGVFKADPIDDRIPATEIDGLYFITENRSIWSNVSTITDYIAVAYDNENDTKIGYAHFEVRYDICDITLSPFNLSETKMLGVSNSNLEAPVSIADDGQLQVTQPELFGVFNSILKQLKIMNFQLSVMTDIEEEEWEDSI